MSAFRCEPDGSVLEVDATGAVTAVHVPEDVWARWEAERLERAERSRPAPKPLQPSRLEVLEAENAGLRAEAHRLRGLADSSAVMLGALAEPCPCLAEALEGAA